MSTWLDHWDRREAGITVTRHVDAQRAVAGVDRLGSCAVALLAPRLRFGRPGRVAQMMIHLS